MGREKLHGSSYLYRFADAMQRRDAFQRVRMKGGVAQCFGAAGRQILQYCFIERVCSMGILS